MKQRLFPIPKPNATFSASSKNPSDLASQRIA